MAVQREKKEEEQTKHSEEEKAKTLKKLQVVEAKQEKYNAQVKEDDEKLKKMGHKIALKEASAQTNTKDLTEKLGLVKTVHESAIQALQAFQESKKESTPDPQAQNAAALAIRTTHSKLQVSIREAEFSHTKEVATKKELKEDIAKEKSFADNLKSARESSKGQRLEDAKYANKSESDFTRSIQTLLRERYETEQSKFTVLKVKEVAAKKELARQKASEAVATEEFKDSDPAKRKVDAPPVDQDKRNKLREEKKKAMEKTEKADNRVKELDADFKGSMTRLMLKPSIMNTSKVEQRKRRKKRLKIKSLKM